ncbi:hypothetical protein P8452_17512 [Trifolium repens]|nr:hypothetical protein P8452_17512 [Trifolium repens]
MKPLLNPLLFFIHSSLKRIRIRSAISFFVETQIDRVLQPCLVYLQQTDYLKHLCKVSVWKSEATEQTEQYKIIALPTHPESVPINALVV